MVNPKAQQNAYTYIVRCNDGTLYTGWTTDLKRRVREHNSKDQGAKYTRTRKPCTLVYYEVFTSEDPLEAKRHAMQREWEIKHKYTKKMKEKIVSDFGEKL